MLDEVFVLALQVFGVLGICYFVFRQWTKIDSKQAETEIEQKLAIAQKVEQDYQKVSKFEEDHKDLPQKIAKVNQFKKKEF